MKDLNNDCHTDNELIIQNIIEAIDLDFKFDNIPFIKILQETSTINVLPHTLEVIKSLNIIISGDIEQIKTLCDDNLSNTSLEFVKEIGESLFAPNIKSLLNLSALYHDIGKVISKPRHAQQGYYFLKIDSEFLYPDDLKELKSYLRELDPDKESVEESLNFIMQIVRYHDVIGTLTTGESSYFLLYPVLNTLLYKKSNFNTVVITVCELYDYLLILTLADMAGTFKLWDDLIKLIIKDRTVIFKAVQSNNFPEELSQHTYNNGYAVERIRRLTNLQFPAHIIKKALKEKLIEKNITPNNFYKSFARICWLDYGWKLFNGINNYHQKNNTHPRIISIQS